MAAETVIGSAQPEEQPESREDAPLREDQAELAGSRWLRHKAVLPAVLCILGLLLALTIALAELGRVTGKLEQSAGEVATLRARVAELENTTASGGSSSGVATICAKRYRWAVIEDWPKSWQLWEEKTTMYSTQVQDVYQQGIYPCGADHLKAYNPVIKQCVPHLDIFLQIPLLRLKERPGYTVEFLGNYNSYASNCESNTYKKPYAWYSPSRLVDCMRAELYKDAANVIEYPLTDEEYFEWHDMLNAVLHAKEDQFTVVDLGARDGCWATRAVVAARQLRGITSYRVVAVEPEPEHVEMMMENFRMNDIDGSKVTVHLSCFGNRPAGGDQVGCSRHIPLAKALENVERVDWLDSDCQGGEEFLVQSPEDAHALETKVVRAHVELHSKYVRDIVVEMLIKHGFEILAVTPFMSLSATEVGPVHFRGGVVIAVNTRFVPVCQQ